MKFPYEVHFRKPGPIHRRQERYSFKRPRMSREDLVTNQMGRLALHEMFRKFIADAARRKSGVRGEMKTARCLKVSQVSNSEKTLQYSPLYFYLSAKHDAA